MKWRHETRVYVAAQDSGSILCVGTSMCRLLPVYFHLQEYSPSATETSAHDVRASRKAMSERILKQGLNPASCSQCDGGGLCWLTATSVTPSAALYGTSDIDMAGRNQHDRPICTEHDMG